MKKNILYVGGFRLPDKSSSAIRVIGIARLFNDLGYRTMIGGKLKAATTENYSDLEFWDTENSSTGSAKQDKDISPIIEKVNSLGKENLKAIIAYNYAPIAFYKLYRYCKKEKIILIPDITEWYLIDGKVTFQSVLRVLLTNWRIAVVSPRCKNMIFAVHYMANRFNKKNSLVLPVVSNQKKTENNKTAQLENKKTVRFVYAGYPGINFSKEKVNWCIESFGELSSKYDNFEYHIIGLDKKTLLKYQPSLKEHFDNAKKKIVAHGRLPYADTIKIIKSASFILFIRPLNRVSNVGFPGKVKEAFDLGVPIITNNTGDLAKYIETGYNGFVINEYSQTALTDLLDSILNLSIEEVHQFKLNCIVKNPFDWEYFQDDVARFLENLKE